MKSEMNEEKTKPRFQMITFKKCCFFIDLKLGCLIFGYLFLVNAIANILLNGSTLTRGLRHLITKQGYEVNYTATTTSILLAWEMLLLLTVMLLFGLHQDKPRFVKVFLVGFSIFLVPYYITNIYAMFFGVYFLLLLRSQYLCMKHARSSVSLSMV